MDDPKKARIYTKSGPARSIVTFYANNYPEYGVPSIVEMACGQVTVIDESKRIQADRDKKADRDAKYKLRLAEFQKKIEAAGLPPRR